MVRKVRGTNGTKSPRMVRKVHGTKRPWYEKSINGTKRLWDEKSMARKVWFPLVAFEELLYKYFDISHPK